MSNTLHLTPQMLAVYLVKNGYGRAWENKSYTYYAPLFPHGGRPYMVAVPHVDDQNAVWQAINKISEHATGKSSADIAREIRQEDAR